MSLRHGILGILNYGESTGYDLAKIFDSSLGFFWDAKKSQIYRELAAIETMGWATSQTVVQQDKPNKKVFQITPQGREELIRWENQPPKEEGIEHRSPLLLQLFFGGTIPLEKNIAHMEAISRAYQAAMEQMKEPHLTIEHYQSILENPQDAEFWKFTADFGARYAKMCYEWSQDVLKRLEEMNR